jgi:hypothetical protein
VSAVHLDDEEWQKVMAIIAQAPWNVANPLLMRIGEQLRAGKDAPPAPFVPPSTDAKERH